MSDEGRNRAAAAARSDDGEPPSASSAASPVVVVAPDVTLDRKEEIEEIFFPNLLKRQNQERKWAALPDDILSEIGERLLAEDVLHYISFRGVCRDWRQSTADPVNTERRFRPRNWILMFRGDKYPCDFLNAKPKLSEQLLHRFINTSSGECVRAHIPELHHHFVCGSVDGLLLLEDWHICTRLLNPFTGSMTEYPAMLKVYNLSMGQLGRHSISFVASFSSTLVATSMKLFAYAKPGDVEWKIIAKTHYVRKPPVFFQERLHICKIGGDLLRFELEELLQDQVELKIITIMRRQAWEMGYVKKSLYLVEFDGDLLMLRWVKRNEYHQYFEVFKVVVRADGVGHENVTLKPINNLGDRALFIHEKLGGVAVSTVISPCIKPNAVYFYEKSSDSQPTIYRHIGPSCRTDPGGYFFWRGKTIQFERNALSILPFIPTVSRGTGHGTDTGLS